MKRKMKEHWDALSVLGKGIVIGIIALIFIIMCIKFTANNNKQNNLMDYAATTEAKEYLEFVWPQNELANMLPIPESNKGEVMWENADEVYICVANTTMEDYNEYITACAEKGFSTVDEEGYGDYNVKNEAGYRLSLSYQNDNVMTIKIKKPLCVAEIEVNCDENLLFSKYDVMIEVDDEEIGVLEHGKSNTYQVELEPGTYTIVFSNEEDASVDGSAEFEIAGNDAYKYNISCEGSQIEVETIVEINPPFASEELAGKKYEEVKQAFEDAGFTNIDTKEIADLKAEEADKEGEVSEISIDDKNQISKEDKFEKDAEVVITYRTCISSENQETKKKKKKKVLTVKNCDELKSILANKAEIDSSYSDFAWKYEGRTIEFDGRIDYVVNHGEYSTRYDILMTAGDYDPNHQTGPVFKFENVAAYDLDLNTLFLEDEIQVGKNVCIKAKVNYFDSDSGLFFLEPVSVKAR